MNLDSKGIVAGLLVITTALGVALARRALRRRGVSMRIVAMLTVGYGVAFGSVWTLFVKLGYDLEGNGTLLWTGIGASAALIGIFGTQRTGRMPVHELGIASLLGIEVAGVLIFASGGGSGDGGGLAAAPVRTLLVAPVAVGLCAYFGASLGYLLCGSGRLSGRFGYELLIGRRFLLSKLSPALSTVTTISVIGVSLGVWLVLVSLGILAGFEVDLQDKIIGANGHVLLKTGDDRPFVARRKDLEAIEDIRGATGSAAVVSGEVAVASYTNFTGGVVFGVDPMRAARVLKVLKQLETGSLKPLIEEAQVPRSSPLVRANQDDETDTGFLPPAPLSNIVIGSEMAKGLDVRVGDTIRILSPILEVLTPVGPAPKSLGFRVCAIFSSKMYEYDAHFAYVTVDAARRFFELGEQMVTGVYVATDDPDVSSNVGAQAAKHLGPGVEALDWKVRNHTLFAALKLERVVAFVVLVFIILVASFSIVNTLSMSVIEKRKEIAILKTMGARDRDVMKVFLSQGLIVGAFGTLVGVFAAVSTVAALKRFGFWIPGEVYYIDSLPVNLDVADIFLVVVAAGLIVWDFSVFPALSGSRLEPVEGLRDG